MYLFAIFGSLNRYQKGHNKTFFYSISAFTLFNKELNLFENKYKHDKNMLTHDQALQTTSCLMYSVAFLAPHTQFDFHKLGL